MSSLRPDDAGGDAPAIAGAPAPERAGTAQTRVDCDVHPGCPGGWRSIFEHLPATWRTRFEGQGLGSRPAFGSDASPESVAGSVFAGAGAGSWALLVPHEPICTWAEPSACAALASAINGYLEDVWTSADARFRTAIVAAPQAPEEAAAEVRRRAGGPAAAVLLPLLNVLMGDERYYPIYAAAAETGLPVIVHPSDADGHIIGAPELAGGPTSHGAVRAAALPGIAQSNVSSLIFRGVFERFPGLKVVFSGFGSLWLVPLLSRMDMDWRRCRIEVPWTQVPPTEYARRHIWCALDRGELNGPGPSGETILGLSPLRESLLRGSHEGPTPLGVPAAAELDSTLEANRERLFASPALGRAIHA